MADLNTFIGGEINKLTTTSGGSYNFNANSSTVQRRTVTANSTFDLIATPGDSVQSVIIELVNGGNFNITWNASINWSEGLAPDLTTNGTDILTFYTTNAGATWEGSVFSKDSK